MAAGPSKAANRMAAPTAAIATKAPAPSKKTTPSPTSKITPTSKPTSTPTPTPAHTHSYTWSQGKQPSCTESGEETGTCSCGDVQIRTVPALGHDYQETNRQYFQDMDSNTHGYFITETCTRCKDQQTRTEYLN